MNLSSNCISITKKFFNRRNDFYSTSRFNVFPKDIDFSRRVSVLRLPYNMVHIWFFFAYYFVWTKLHYDVNVSPKGFPKEEYILVVKASWATIFFGGATKVIFSWNYCYTFSNLWKLLLYCFTAENLGSSNFAVIFLKFPIFFHRICKISVFFLHEIIIFLQFFSISALS